MSSVNIIIVNWNTGALLARCLRALRNLPEGEGGLIGKIIVVDNNSSDNSVVLAQAEARNWAEVSFKLLPENVGFARGNNVAWKTFSSHNHVLLLNPDTEVRPGAVRALVGILEERADVGIVGPKLINPDGTLQGSVRPFPTFFDFILYMLKLGRIVQNHQERLYEYSQAGYVDQVMGAVFLIRNKAWQEIGMLDERFFTLFEEVDYCKRAVEHGWKTYFTPAGEVMHVRAASFNQLVGFRKSWPWMASCLRYAHKHFGVGLWLLMIILSPVTLLLTLPAMVKHYWLKLGKRRTL